MLLWRISNHSSLDGRGGLFADGRWHHRGTAVLYMAESPAGALLEILVHLELDIDSLPPHFRLLKIEVPEHVTLLTVDESGLPQHWRENSEISRAVGTDWLATAETPLLRVPSAIVPETFNVLLNPAHPAAAQLTILSYNQYPWDRRLLNKR